MKLPWTLTYLALPFFSPPLVSAQAQNDAADTICGTVVNSTVDAYKCLISTPFRPDVAKELLAYWRTTLEFQSTLAYLKNPPRSYQQPAIDLLRSLDLIRADIDTGVFQNQYSFEAAVQDVIYAAHDTHVQLLGSILGVFVFGAPFELITLSPDGTSIPRTYMMDDVAAGSDQELTASPLETINGEPAEDFLAVYASHNTFGFLEPHGDWNGIMYSAVGALMGSSDALASTYFYPGENITVVLENGTTYGPMPWQAYNLQADGITINTGEDLYDYFVLGQVNYPADADDGRDDGSDSSSASTTAEGVQSTELASATVTTASTETTDTPAGQTSSASDDDAALTSWGFPYPDTADVYQPELGFGGVLTGYFLPGQIGVLSIPSFQEDGYQSQTFSHTIGEFLKKSKQAGMTKIVVDLQQNTGGLQLLATDTFRQFFPGIDPFSGMRTRSFDTANELGITFTNQVGQYGTLNESYQSALIGDPFAVTLGELNADNNQNFTDWAEYFGPHPDNGDLFSTVFKYNLSSEIFDESVGDIVIYGYGNRSQTDPQPYAAKDIVLLTDGACASTCDLFVEMMHHEAGVRTIVVGGLPQYGPMQARGGTRGAYLYTSDELDGDFSVGAAFNASLATILPDRTMTNATIQSYLTFNMADQIRPREYTPVQFSYEAADCRIWYTPQTWNNMTALWLYAATASFFDAKNCVAHSAEHNNTLDTDLWGPSPEQKAAWAQSNPAWVPPSNTSGSPTVNLAQLSFTGHGPHEAWDEKIDGNNGKPCTSVAVCGPTNMWQCRDVQQCAVDSRGQARFTQGKECRKLCDQLQSVNSCGAGYTCTQDKTFIAKSGKAAVLNKFCERRASAQDKVCLQRIKQATSLPVQPTVLPGTPVDLVED